MVVAFQSKLVGVCQGQAWEHLKTKEEVLSIYRN